MQSAGLTLKGHLCGKKEMRPFSARENERKETVEELAEELDKRAQPLCGRSLPPVPAGARQPARILSLLAGSHSDRLVGHLTPFRADSDVHGRYTEF